MKILRNILYCMGTNNYLHLNIKPVFHQKNSFEKRLKFRRDFIIVNLIARFWDTDSGTVSIGGTDIKAMTTESLLENISVVFQNVYLFNDTIFNNVAFGKKVQRRKRLLKPAKRLAAMSLYPLLKIAMTR